MTPPRKQRVRKDNDARDDEFWNMQISVSLSGYQRRLINSYFGEPGMAKLSTCKSFILGNGMGALDDLDYQAQQDGLPGDEGYELGRRLKLRSEEAD